MSRWTNEIKCAFCIKFWNFGGRTTEMDSAQHSVNPRVLVRGGDLKKKKKKKISLALVSLRFFCRRE